MRVLIVTHRSLPAHPAGTEVHTHTLARALAEEGHDVRVLTAEKDVSRRDLSVHEREHEGVRYTELVNNLFHTSFEQTYRHPGCEARFAELLDAWKPDVVHASHLLYHSTGYARIARERGFPFFMTLFDFWLMCPRFGQRRFGGAARAHRGERSITEDLCATIERERCARCMADFKFAATGTERRVGGVLATLKRATGVDLARLAKRMAGSGSGGATSSAGVANRSGASTGAADPAWMARLERRERAMREELVPHVDGFVAPSRFLRTEFLEWGLAAERVHFVRTGIDLAPFTGFERVASDGPVRVRFVGTIVPHKAPHVLAEAFERLESSERERLSLDVHGPDTHAEDYARDLERRIVALGGRYHGALARNELAGTLARTDLLVVPSIWYENAPLVILEALATHTPVAVSDLGGMRELALESGAGFAFPAGDAEALAAVLRAAAITPESLRSTSANPSVRSIQDDARDFAALWRGALAR